MKLISLELTNFRQFYGKQTIDFASGSDGRNITVFHGFNGSGKTALLNTFVWCLYGELTPDLDHKDRLVNERAFAEAQIGNEVPCRVALQFEFRGETYVAERAETITKTGSLDSQKSRGSLSLLKRSVGGETEQVGRDEGARQHRIEQMLPRSLYRFFFFNGERVEGLASPDAYENIEAGVKTLLDIEVYERGADHLRSGVTKALAEEAKRAGDDRLADAMDQLAKMEEEKNRLQAENHQHEENVSALFGEIQSAERRQEDLRDVAQMATRRNQLRDEEAELSGQLNQESRSLASQVSKNGYLAFGIRALDLTDDQVAAARKRGDLPAKIKPQFVDDLLAAGACICGRPIGAHTPEEKILHKYRASTGLAELEERIAGVSANIRSLRERRSEIFEACIQSLKKMASLRAKLRICKEDLSAINERISEGNFGEEAARIQQLIRDRGAEVLSNKVAIQRNIEKMSGLETAISDIRDRTKKLETLSAKAELAKRQLEAVQRVADALAQIRDIQKEDVRRSLDEKVGEIWREAAIKGYDASITQRYQLLLTKTVGGQRQPVMGASTGEKQVLALSFVGAMVSKAKENAARKENDLDMGGFFPLVMDSPFGSLEDEYRTAVATWLPTLANQVVVMASKTQWRNEVEKAMRPRIGREYILELHTPKKSADRQVTLDGKEYPYVVTDNGEDEMTTIRRVM